MHLRTVKRKNACAQPRTETRERERERECVCVCVCVHQRRELGLGSVCLLAGGRQSCVWWRLVGWTETSRVCVAESRRRRRADSATSTSTCRVSLNTFAPYVHLIHWTDADCWLAICRLQCVGNSKDYVTSTLSFIKSHQLMFDVVTPHLSEPLFYSKNLSFSRFAVDFANSNTVLILYRNGWLLVM